MMNAHRLRALSRGGNFFPPAFALLFLIVVAFGFALSTAQEPGQHDEAKEREVEVRMAPHLPFKAKLRSPEKMKDLKNDDWLGDLELEITNTGMKPIYKLSFVMLLPAGVSTTTPDRGMAYDVAYGRIGLVDLTEPLRSDDVPILPGESIVIKLPPEKLKTWKNLRTKGKLHNPKKLSFWFQFLNHGDGTGFLGPDGVPLPNKDTRRSANRCQEGRADVAGLRPAEPRSSGPPSPPSYFTLSMPVSFSSPAVFLPQAPPRRRSSRPEISAATPPAPG